LLFMPTCAVLGVPTSRPLVRSKVAHAGMFCTENNIVAPAPSLADGWKE
jgi:hypothetical protein